MKDGTQALLSVTRRLEENGWGALFLRLALLGPAKSLIAD
jgi:hypothetical protein